MTSYAVVVECASDGGYGVWSPDLPGVAATEWDDIGGRAAGRGTLYFDNVRIPASHLVGEENRGFMQVMQGFDYSRALIGLQCLAVAKVGTAQGRLSHSTGIPSTSIRMPISYFAWGCFRYFSFGSAGRPIRR